MSRFTDALIAPRPGVAPPLPVIDWARIGQQAPTKMSVLYAGPSAPLPRADVAVLTWTSAEWSALDQVFLDSDTTRSATSREFERAWEQFVYARDVGTNTTDNPDNPLWGYFRVVEVSTAVGGTATVLLFKCGAHLAHPPWIAGLSQMVSQILEDAQPRTLYSIGTAGGTQSDVRLGDVVITDCAEIRLKMPDNAASPLSGKAVQSAAGFKTGSLLTEVQENLMFSMQGAVNEPVLARTFYDLTVKIPAASSFTVGDLLNDAITPANLTSPSARPMAGTPLLTTDYYYIASGTDSTQWSALEMDDGVVGAIAGQHGTPYIFVRNISDPVVPNVTAAGDPIPDPVRDGWSGLVYNDFGIYSSFNGALATWALIVGEAN